MVSRLGILGRGSIDDVPLHLRERGWQELFGRFVDESETRILLRLLYPRALRLDKDRHAHSR